jgi:hypothetical protein
MEIIIYAAKGCFLILVGLLVAIALVSGNKDDDYPSGGS